MNTIMKKRILTFHMVLTMVVISLIIPTTSFAARGISPHDLAKKILKKLGGHKAWKKSRYIRFDYVVEKNGEEIKRYKHLWDKNSGNYRMEWIETEATSIIALINISSKVGTVYINGKPVEYDQINPYIQVVYEKFLEQVRGIYFLYKLLEPGNKVSFQDPWDTSRNGKYQVLHVSHDSNNLLQEGDYWLLVDMKSKLPTKYRFKSDSGNIQEFYLQNWIKCGKLYLPTTHQLVNGKTVVMYDNMKVFNYITPQIFETIHLHLP